MSNRDWAKELAGNLIMNWKLSDESYRRLPNGTFEWVNDEPFKPLIESVAEALRQAANREFKGQPINYLVDEPPVFMPDEIDTHGGFDSETKMYTIPKSGRYRIIRKDPIYNNFYQVIMTLEAGHKIPTDYVIQLRFEVCFPR